MSMKKEVISKSITGVLVTIIVSAIWWVFGNLSTILWNGWLIISYPIPVPAYILSMLSGATLFLVIIIIVDQIKINRGPKEPQ